MISVRKLLAVLLAVVLISVSCTSYQIINSPYKDLKVGEKIRLTMSEGDRHEITVVSVSENVIAGPDSNYSLLEIEFIEKKGFSMMKSGWLAFAVSAVVFIFWMGSHL